MKCQLELKQRHQSSEHKLSHNKLVSVIMQRKRRRRAPSRSRIKMKSRTRSGHQEESSTAGRVNGPPGCSAQSHHTKVPARRQVVYMTDKIKQARKTLPSQLVILILVSAGQLLAPPSTSTSDEQILLGCSAQMQTKFQQASPLSAQLQAAQSPSLVPLQPPPSGTETQLVRGLANSAGSRLELPCLVDQANCGEVYYITWTKQANQSSTSSASSLSRSLPTTIGGAQTGQQQQVTTTSTSGLPWSRVYLYTGANDSAPHKPIGDLVSRATFVMPEPQSSARQQPPPPLARLVIEEPRLSDEALYKCDVTYVKGKCPSISLVRVQMMALPERAQIFQVPPGAEFKSKRGQLQPLASGQQIGPLNEHDQLRLVCVVTGGRPAPKAVFWRKIDLTGRTINLAPSTALGNTGNGEQLGRTFLSPRASAGGEPQTIEVALNHTLTSGDLNAKFECHVEHEALEKMRPAARIISATTNNNNQQQQQGAKMQDALLDLHPSASSINRHDEQLDSRELGEELGASNAASGLVSLDSYVIIDLNVGVQSLDLFLNKLSPNQAASSNLLAPTTIATSANKRAGSEPNGPLKEGDLIELECIAYNSKPAANITWLNGSDVIGGGGQTGAANIDELEGSSTRRSVQERRLDAMGTLAWQQAGQMITARSQRNRRLLQRNHMQLNPDGQTYDTHSFLSVKLSRHENGAQISCQARNGPMREPMVKSIELQVQHAPIVLMEPAAGITVAEYEPPSLKKRPNTNVIISSERNGQITVASQQQPADQVQIYCIYSANPVQLVAGSTRWFKDGQPLAVAGERLIESTTQNGYPMLTIKQVSRHDAGKYDCQLTNNAGTSERLAASEASKLEVNFRPSVQLRIYKTTTTTTTTTTDQEAGTVELDLDQSLVMAGDELELVCEVLEARPNNMDKFNWFSSARGSTPLRPLATTDGQRFKLGPLTANFTPSSFACTAHNSIGQSEPSNTVELELSHTPGPSYVRPVASARVRKLIVSSGKPVPSNVAEHDDLAGWPQQQTGENDEMPAPMSGRPLSAGKELLLECVTQELGRPRANIWLWFKNGQTIGDIQTEFKHDNNNNPSGDLGALVDNPISDRLQQDLSSSASPQSRRNQEADNRHQQAVRLLASGRYLFIPTIQLAHKGNYSCVAVNRLGSGGSSGGSSLAASSQSPSAGGGRDSYQLRVALAPSFVQPMAAKTYWPETQTVAETATSTKPQQQQQQQRQHRQLELVCHVQCEPICQIEWLRNNEPLDIKDGNNNHVSYHVRHSIMDENETANMFRSVESRLVLSFDDLHLDSTTTNQKLDKRPPPPPIDRDRLLVRRHFLNSSNFTCQSGPNSMGPQVRSTTKLVVQYPPENVLISAPSDKLNLVEGSRGPLLSCEASAEPHAQYRWLLLRNAPNNIITSSDLVAARYNVKHFANATGQQQQLDRYNNKRSFAPMAQPNDAGESQVGQAPATPLDAAIGERLVELTGPSNGEQVGGTSVSTLDLGNISIDRKQSGHYICEASNSLGQTRQSVYVNVLYKPTCTTLHMHSLDLTAPAGRRPAGATKENDDDDDEEEPLVAVNRPSGATKNDEYSIVRETSEDFIGLRRVLVMSPLLSDVGIHVQNPQQQAANELGLDQFLLRGSIFSAMLDSPSTAGGKRLGSAAAIRDGSEQDAALIHGADPKDDSAKSNAALLSANSYPQQQIDSSMNPNRADSWTKFNEILLKFLNDYSRLIKHDEERRSKARSLERSTERNQQQQQQQQTRRSSLASSRASMDGIDQELPTDANELGNGPQRDHQNDQDAEPVAPSNKRHEDSRSQQARLKRSSLLTFACMAQEGNPMANLTFDWYFGAVRLPVTNQQLANDNIDNSLGDQRSGQYATSGLNTLNRPNLIYSNPNETLAIMLTRRLDTGTALNPFQMSFLTVNIVVVSLHEKSLRNYESDSDDEQQSTSSALNAAGINNNTILLKAPVLKSRYQSFYGLGSSGLQANGGDLYQSSSGPNRRSNNNIPIGQEFDSLMSNIHHQRQHHSNHGQADIEINEHNWRERLSQLLSCSVSNSVGTSEPCYVKPLDRSKIGGANSNGLAGSSSLYEFAKWRMPSIAQKSLLIISVIIGCSLIVFATFALLIGPHLRAMQLLHKRPDSGAGSSSSTKDDQGAMHTGQSTSSQKSSVLGLLGNGTDSSFPGSSDDDTSGRLNQLDSNICANGSSNNHHMMRQQPPPGGRIFEEDTDELSPGNRLLSLSGGGSQFDYDLPRNVQTSSGPRLVYQPDVGNFNLQTDSASYENYHYHESQQSNGFSANHNRHQQVATGGQPGKPAFTSTSGRILASLKSKFKVQDRISDLPTSRWSALHNRNVSNSETATTGISASGQGNESPAGANNHSASQSGTSRTMLHSLGVPVNLRHSYAGARPQTHRQAYQPMTLAKPSSYSYASSRDQTNNSLDDATYNRLLQLNSQVLNKQSACLMGDNQQETPPNAMDEFMRRRGFDTPFDLDHGDTTLASAYGSQSIRNQSSTIYALRNDLIQLNNKLPGSRIKPPVYPRTTTSYGLTSRQQQQMQPNYHISAMYKSTPPPPPIAARAPQRDQVLNRQSLSGVVARQHLVTDNLAPAAYSESNIIHGHQFVSNATNRFDTIDSHLNRLADSVALGYYNDQEQQQIAYANTMDINHPYAHGQYNNPQLGVSMINNQSAEHIYDLNAYATPEQTPLRRPNVVGQDQSSTESERLRVSQLIQTFNTKLPDHST